MKKKQRDFKGIWIPKEIWLSKDLTLQEKIFLVEIDSLDNETGCFAGNDYFSKFFGISKTRVSIVINNLVKKGYIISKIKYKDGSKQILNRVLNICYRPYTTKVIDPIQQKLKDNNTTNNTTNNNKKSQILNEECKTQFTPNETPMLHSTLSTGYIIECENWLNYYNKVNKTSYRSINPIVKNFKYWRETYSIPEMEIVIKVAKIDPFFKDKLTPTLLLRTRNKNGDCDYIGDLLNKYKGEYVID